MDNFSVAAVFSDHMVLQRNKYITIFGTGNKNMFITATLENQAGTVLSENTTMPDSNGKWTVNLKQQEAQNNCKLIITTLVKEPVETQNIKIFEDVAIGEVWLAGGQSNMEFELQNCTEGPQELIKAELAAAANLKTDEQESSKKKQKSKKNKLQNSELNSEPNVRYYYTNKIAWKDDAFYEAELNTCWQTWESSAKGSWSAVGYFFAKKLAEACGCTVGIIGCNWGGTSASAWMRREFLEKDSQLNTYLSEYTEELYGKTIEQQIKEYNDYEMEYAKWQSEYSKLWQQDNNISWEKAETILGKNPWPGPKSCKNPYRPTGLYDCMLSRIIPYTIKGVLWYQGESDDHKPEMYYKLFTALIDNWRTDWHDDSLPFVFVQLPVHRYEADKDFKHWCLIREAQAKVFNTIRNTWMTCALDLGQYNDIHPKAKKEVGERLAANALANIYHQGTPEDVLSPMLENASIVKNKIILYFKNAQNGFSIRDDKQALIYYRAMEKKQGTDLPPVFTGFEIAGEDGIYYPSAYRFSQEKGMENTITLSSPLVKQPVSARYAWYNYGPVTIYGNNGLPLCPFRTTPF